MLEVLLSSGARVGFRPGGALMAGAIHAAVIAAAVAGRVPPGTQPVVRVDSVVLVDPWNPPSPPGLSQLPSLPESPKPFVLPTTDLPDLPRLQFEASESGPDVATVIGVRAGSPVGIAEAVSPGRVSETLLPGEVDQPVTVIEQGRPAYPRHLASRGVSGVVVLQFVVDTTGGVPPSSVRIVSSSHGEFEAPAVVAVLASRFTPARLGARPVPQLVTQRITFRAAGRPSE